MKFLEKLSQIKNAAKALYHYINGDFSYQNYLKNSAHKNSCDKKILSKKEFLQAQQKSKWEKINRCC